jgi:hypothetical protein
MEAPPPEQPQMGENAAAAPTAAAGKKKNTRKWTDEEVAALKGAIEAAATSTELLNWADVAKAVPGRTGKQCREKYKVTARSFYTLDHIPLPAHPSLSPPLAQLYS